MKQRNLCSAIKKGISTVLVLSLMILGINSDGMELQASTDTSEKATNYKIEAKPMVWNYGNAGVWRNEQVNDGYVVGSASSIDVVPGANYAVSVTFTAPENATLTPAATNPAYSVNAVRLYASDENSDGVRMAVFLNDTKIYPTDALWTNVSEVSSYTTFSLPTLTLKQGDKLRYIIDNGGAGNNVYDHVYLDIAGMYTNESGTVSNSYVNFSIGLYHGGDISGDATGIGAYTKNQLITYESVAIKEVVSGSPSDSTYFFFDDRVVSATDNVTLKQGKIAKASTNATTNATWADQYNWTMNGDTPDWEQRLSIMYPYVEYDPDGLSVDGTSEAPYKVWYWAWFTKSPVADFDWRANLIDSQNSRGTDYDTTKYQIDPKGTIYYAGENGSVLCYMESIDGVTWTRPNCDQFYYKKQDGTVVGTNIVCVGNHGMGVTRNDNPDEGEPKYLSMGSPVQAPAGVAITWSYDGIHWEELIEVFLDASEQGLKITADTHNQIHWSKELQSYVVITRAMEVENGIMGSARKVAQSSSVNLESITDLKTIKDNYCNQNGSDGKYWNETTKYWSEPEITIDGPHDGAQPYSMPVMCYEDGYYIGVVSTLDWVGSTAVQFQVSTKLVWSPDLMNWYYIDDNETFIPNSSIFEYAQGNDYGMIYPAAPVVTEDGIQLYYCGTPELHYGAYSQIPTDIKAIVDEKIPAAATAGAVTRTPTLNMATLDFDAFAGYQGGSGSGTLTTKEFNIGDITNLRISASNPSGVVIQAINSDGEVISNGTLNADCVDQRNRYVVSWEDDNVATSETVSFKITVPENECIYAISGNIEIVAEDTEEDTEEVQTPIFTEDFESGLDQWTVRDKTAGAWTDTAPYTNITIEGTTHNGSGSLGLQKSGSQVLIRKTFNENFNKVLTVWFYDDITVNETRAMACMDLGDTRISLGISTYNTNTDYYHMWTSYAGAQYTNTNVSRTTGWHRFVWDATSGTHIDVYIDGIKVTRITQMTNFNQITLGWWNKAVGTKVAFDDVSITDTMDNYYNLAKKGAYVLTGESNTVDGTSYDAGTAWNQAGEYLVHSSDSLYLRRMLFYRTGDAHVDDKLDVRDLVATLKAVKGTTLDTQVAQKAADADESGDLGANDVVCLQKHLTGETYISGDVSE